MNSDKHKNFDHLLIPKATLRMSWQIKKYIHTCFKINKFKSQILVVKSNISSKEILSLRIKLEIDTTYCMYKISLSTLKIDSADLMNNNAREWIKQRQKIEEKRRLKITCWSSFNFNWSVDRADKIASIHKVQFLTKNWLCNLGNRSLKRSPFHLPSTQLWKQN